MAAVTVVITLYNKEKYITHAIQSVLDQTFQDWELLIIDDASTDASLAKARQFKDSRIRIIQLRNNIGQTNVLNYALTQISTPYFVQLDADDWLDKKTLGVMMRTAKQRPDAALIYGNHMMYWLNEQGEVEKKEPIVLEQYKDKYDLLYKMNYAMVPRFYRTEVLRSIGGWMVQSEGDRLAEDVQITLRLAKDHSWVWINDILYHRRRDPENWRNFERTRPTRRKYRYDLYNQVLKEWGDEYRAQWKVIDQSYYLEKLVPNPSVQISSRPRYTIVIPNYNHARTLLRAVKSALEQTLPADRILIIDDASQDQSLERLTAYIKHSKIRILKFKRNVGISKLLNTALKYIRTPYFIQLDGDDWLEPNAAERLVTALHYRPDAAFSYANHRLWEKNAQGKYVCVDHIQQPVFRSKYDFLLKLGYMLNPRCYRAEAIRRINGWVTDDPWQGRYYEDARMVIRLTEFYTWVHVPELLHNVRINRAKSQHKIKYYNYLRQNFYEAMLRQWGGEYEAVWQTAPTGRIVLERLQPKR